ncbi:ABC transporter [Streptomyces drozdowiczii]
MLSPAVPPDTRVPAGLPRGRLLALLLRSSLRAMPKVPLALGGLISLLITAVPALVHTGLGLSDVAVLSRVAAAAVALGAGFVLDDPAARTTVAVPVTRRTQRAVRAAPALVLAMAMWAAAVALARTTLPQDARPLLPWGGLAAEAAALVAISLALATVGLRFTEGERGSLVAAPGILLLVITAALLPQGAALFLPPGHTSWTAAHQVWTALVPAALAGAALLAGGADSARPAGR